MTLKVNVDTKYKVTTELPMQNPTYAELVCFNSKYIPLRLHLDLDR